MEFPKQLKDIVYNLLQEPTLDNFREFLHSQMGEHNSIDFKGHWIEGASLAKEILALANSGGGIIVFGVAENEDKTTKIDGLSEIRDKAVVSNDIKKYVSSDLKYDVYDFSYDTAEYEVLKNKKFQMIVVEDTPAHIPFLAKRESGTLKENMIYIRRGTSCEIVNQEELESILKRRINYMHPVNGKPLDLEEHLQQLKVLYKNIDKEKIYYGTGTLGQVLRGLISYVGQEKRREPNPLYPDEEYEKFISRLITAKKNKIERVLDLY